MDAYLLRDVALARSQVAELKALWRRTRDERDLLVAKLQQLQQARQVGPDWVKHPMEYLCAAGARSARSSLQVVAPGPRPRERPVPLNPRCPPATP
jgi:hypothetical protein